MTGLTRRKWLAAAAAAPAVAVRARAATPLAQSKPLPKGAFAPMWDSLRQLYQAPRWFDQARFGIFIHWGVYAVPAYHNEWYSKHMYAQFAKYHTEHYGSPDQFGYKDFIPLFKAEHYDPSAWAALFRESGAKYVVPVAEHHDGFAMYASDLTRWCAAKMGPKRDLIGGLASAVRREGLIFGLSSHRMEHHTFMYPAEGVPNDQFDPAYADFYGPPVPGHMNDGNASPAFQDDWLARCQELIDKYRPRMLWFDNGVNAREYDAVKLKCAAYYYNRAAEWKQEVSLSTKAGAYLAGSILDFEKAVRGPKQILSGPWQVDDQIATNTWGYTNDIRYRSTISIVDELIDVASKGGNLLLNISPMAGGTIPGEQQSILREIGAWLKVNGEAIYGSAPWRRYGEGPSTEASADQQRRVAMSPAEFRFTTRNGALYAAGMRRPPEGEAVVRSLAKSAGRAAKVELLGGGALAFTQDENALRVKLPTPTVALPYVLKIVWQG